MGADGTPIGNEAQANSFASAGGIFTGDTGGSATATASASLDSYVDTNATVRARGNITIASLANDQTESQMTGVGGGFVGIGVGASSATDSGSAMARMNGTVTSGQSLTLTANSLDNAGSTSYGFSGGVVTVDAASADAEASPTVNAAIGGGATLSGPVIVQATTDKSVTATVKGGAVGGVAIAGMMASANAGGPTTAQVNGAVQAGARECARHQHRERPDNRQ